MVWILAFWKTIIFVPCVVYPYGDFWIWGLPWIYYNQVCGGLSKMIGHLSFEVHFDTFSVFQSVCTVLCEVLTYDLCLARGQEEMEGLRAHHSGRDPAKTLLRKLHSRRDRRASSWHRPPGRWHALYAQGNHTSGQLPGRDPLPSHHHLHLPGLATN